MNIKHDNKSNVHLPHNQRTLTIESTLLHVGNIVYCPYRATNANIIKISAEDDVTTQFYGLDFPTCRFASNLLQLEKSNPYTVTGQLF